VAVAHDADAPPALILDVGTGLRHVTGLLAGQPYHRRPDRTDDELDQVARSFAASPVPVTVAAEGLVLDV
jgi:hypothetical protein